MSPDQLQALERLFELAGVLLKDVDKPSKPKAFIGSAVEGLEIANKLQELLAYDLSCVVWNQDTVFGLGSATLEALEKAVEDFDFGIFVFTPDDQLYSRGATMPVARDNVVFEAGLFIGKLTRWRAFVVQPRSGIVLPSDFRGITTAQYDPNERNLAAALGPVCNRVREAVNKALAAEARR